MKQTNTFQKQNLFGQIHAVDTLQGVGPEYKERLKSLGIVNTEQLWTADAEKVAENINTSVSAVRSWQNMAELSCIKDIGPQYSELLERSGVHSVAQLKKYKATDLLKLIQKKQDSLNINIQGNTPGELLVQNWIKQARSHKKS